uniref:Uncharacterized protein n=1 Tax=Knipowitschia caucasica TaxID=637954 RepID=A0AAV2K7M4_KNICA
MVSLELKETLVQRERGESLVYQGPGVRMVLRGQRVVLGPQVNLDQLDLLEIRENLASLAFLDIRED